MHDRSTTPRRRGGLLVALALLTSACGATQALPLPTATSGAVSTPAALRAVPTAPATSTSAAIPEVPTPAPSRTPRPGAATSATTATPARSPVATRTAAPTRTAGPGAAATAISSTPAHPVAVMIDNIKTAWPQSGLGDADVVYEAPAEGGITRLMAVFFEGGPARVGPVRSARDYFVDLAAEYHAVLVHIGASPMGFRALALTGLVDVDEIRNGPGFSRDPRRAAPHNAYINLPQMRRALAAQGEGLQGTTGGITFGSTPPAASGQPAASIEIDYPGGEHHVSSFAYDEASHTYLRSMDGLPHTDAETGQRYAARAVIVELVPAAPISGDEAGRLDVGVVGSGAGLLLLDGRSYPVTWSKSDDAAPTLYSYAEGGEVALPRGQVWIQVVPRDARVTLR